MGDPPKDGHGLSLEQSIRELGWTILLKLSKKMVEQGRPSSIFDIAALGFEAKHYLSANGTV